MVMDSQCSCIWLVFFMQTNIKFPIDLDYLKLKSASGPRNRVENSTDSTAGATRPQTNPLKHKGLKSVLLKADMGADVNLMNNVTFNSLFDRSALQLTPLKMENYGNTGIKVLGKFHAFLKWKDRVYRQLLYITDCDKSPNVLSRDACYTLGVLKPCYSVEHSTDCTEKPSKVGKSFLYCRNEGSAEKLSDNSCKCSISKEQLQGGPLMKQHILEVYSDIFTRTGKFPGSPYKFQLKPNVKSTRHAPRKVPIHLQETFHEEIRNIGRNQRCY